MEKKEQDVNSCISPPVAIGRVGCGHMYEHLASENTSLKQVRELHNFIIEVWGITEPKARTIKKKDSSLISREVDYSYM